jgi:hypothetical protein
MFAQQLQYRRKAGNSLGVFEVDLIHLDWIDYQS